MDAGMKPHLELPHDWRQHLTYWNRTLCRMLIDSEMFQVTEDLFHFHRSPGVRNCNFHIMRLDGKIVGVDTWDTWDPTAAYFSKGVFSSWPYNMCKLIKIQYYPCAFWEKFTRETHIPVTPWTIFPSSEFPLEYFQWSPDTDKAYVGLLTGRNDRFGRQRWMDWCRKDKGFYVQENNRHKIEATEFLSLLRQSQWGICLKGKQKHHDGKNRRECEYASCGIPLVLNYIPTYPFPMVPNVDFYYVKDPEDLKALWTVDPKPFAAASRELYRKYFSPKGMSQTLCSLILNCS